jgi:hypothetical protein
MTFADDPVQRAAEHAVADLHVEREGTDDGRYVLYFSWPAGSQPKARDEPAEADV